MLYHLLFEFVYPRTHLAVLSNGQKLPVSRLQSRILREQFLKL